MTQLSPKLGAVVGLKQPVLLTEGITSRQLAILLKEAAAEAEQRVAHNLARGTFSGQVTAQQLKTAIAGIGPLSTELWTGVGQVTRAGMYQGAQLAADTAIDLDFLLGMPGIAILQYVDAIYYSAAQVVEDLVSRHTTGVALSERIYANGKATVTQVGRIVDKGLIQQLSAKQIASQVKGFYDPNVPGGASYAAMRLGRTEINNAHHDTTRRLAADKPWVNGMKWNLSGSHPRPDVCNDYAERNHEGLGRGVFKPQNAPGKPHPQCLCYLTHVSEDPQQFMNKLAKGNYDGWLDGKGVHC